MSRLKKLASATLSAAALACAAPAPASASIVWEFDLPGQSDSLSVITDGNAVGGVVADGKYNITDVVINSSSVFGNAVVGFSVLAGELGLSTNGTPSEGGSTDPANNFILWHGAGNRFEINDLGGDGNWLDIYFANSLPGHPGDRSDYRIYTWFGGSPNYMFARLDGQLVAGDALDAADLVPAEPAAVPAPATLLLGVTSLAALLATGRRRRASVFA